MKYLVDIYENPITYGVEAKNKKEAERIAVKLHSLNDYDDIYEVRVYEKEQDE